MVKTLAIIAYLFGNVQGHEAPLQMASSAFQNDHAIPKRYTCRGRNISIPLRWRYIPPGTRSLAVIMTDEGAPKDRRYLWALYNIPPQQKWLRPNASLVRGEQYAMNSWGHVNYDGPCPTQGEHRYVVRLYALNTRLYFDKTINAAQLKDAMHNHIITTAKIEGWYRVGTMTVRRKERVPNNFRF